MTITFLGEERSAELIDAELAFDAVHRAFLTTASGGAENFPTVIGHGRSPGELFAIKSATSPLAMGAKIAAYWPGNVEVPRHSSTIVLLDPGTGQVDAVVEAGAVNGYRTAAADAVAADVLAREDAEVLAIFGTGHQALFECLALARVRPLREVLVVARTAEHGESFRDRLAAAGLTARLVDAATACADADIVVTATTARSPLFEAEWIRPGTHVASMGSDAPGKQELPVDLLTRSTLFCDLRDQSTKVGEYQHIAELVERGEVEIAGIGDVLAGTAPGRSSRDEVTVFDSSGIAVQDLAVAVALLEADGKR